ncbi:hypothetical protein FRB93_000399 [Tulasnella sp. JGI-2019a]|nr:hypothetical protein FRB93_000399 [Tulasnella sp. JGI-2019a]
MVIPLCKRFDFYFVKDASEEFYAGGDKILSSLLVSATVIQLNITPAYAKFRWRTTRADSDLWPFQSTISWPGSEPTYSVLMGILGHTLPPVHLTIDHDKTWPIRRIAPLLSALPSVISLELKSDRPQGLILDLTTPQSSSPNGWLLPRLQTLKISAAPIDRSLLLRMVQARHDGGPGPVRLVEGADALPSRLESVGIIDDTRCKRWDDKDLTPLRDIATEVRWSIAGL